MSMAARVFMFIWTQLSVSMLCYYHCAYLHRAMNCNVCHHLYESFEIWMIYSHHVCMCVCFFFWSSWCTLYIIISLWWANYSMCICRMSTYFKNNHNNKTVRIKMEKASNSKNRSTALRFTTCLSMWNCNLFRLFNFINIMTREYREHMFIKWNHVDENKTRAKLNHCNHTPRYVDLYIMYGKLTSSLVFFFVLKNGQM